LVEKDQIKRVLDRLVAVEAAMGDPAVISDAARYRATVREHTALRKLEAAAKRYFKILDDIRQNHRFNGDNEQWLSTRHGLVVGAWKDAEAAIELNRKQLEGMLGALGPIHIGVDVERKTARSVPTDATPPA
jgi:protein subunit release factor A